MPDTKISISKGNDKLGSICNISLPPIVTCPKNTPCSKRCYARRIYVRRPVVRKAWNKNLKLYQDDPNAYFQLLDQHLKKSKLTHFRFHVSGDIPDKNYFIKMLQVVDNNKDIKFLVFTKRFDLLKDFNQRRNNLSIVLSMWPGMQVGEEVFRSFPKAWVYDKNNIDDRIPANVSQCNSNCQTCDGGKGKNCWSLYETKQDVVFHIH